MVMIEIWWFNGIYDFKLIKFYKKVITLTLYTLVSTPTFNLDYKIDTLYFKWILFFVYEPIFEVLGIWESETPNQVY
jgi:hypothetical protein